MIDQGHNGKLRINADYSLAYTFAITRTYHKVHTTSSLSEFIYYPKDCVSHIREGMTWFTVDFKVHPETAKPVIN